MTRGRGMAPRFVLAGVLGVLIGTAGSFAEDTGAPSSAAWGAAISKPAKETPATAVVVPPKPDTVAAAKTAKPSAALKAAASSTLASGITPAGAAPASPAGPATPSNAVAPAAAPAAVPADAKASIVTGAIPAPASPQAVKAGDWLLECASGTSTPSCTLRQVISDSKNRRIIEFRAQSVRNTPFLEVFVPVGISIPYGVTVDIEGGKKIPAQLVDCLQNGCRAVLPLGAENLGALKAAKTLAVTFQDSKSGKVISISGSPKGFDLGIGKVIGAG